MVYVLWCRQEKYFVASITWNDESNKVDRRSRGHLKFCWGTPWFCLWFCCCFQLQGHHRSRWWLWWLPFPHFGSKCRDRLCFEQSVRAHLSISPSSPFSPWLNTPSWVSTLCITITHVTWLRYRPRSASSAGMTSLSRTCHLQPFWRHPLYTIKTQGKLPGGIDGSTYTPYTRGQVLPYRNIRPFLTRSAIHGHRNTVFFQW